MKILHVIPALPEAAGTSVFCAEICNSLSVLGCTCVVAVQTRDPDHDHPVLPAVQIHQVDSKWTPKGFVPDLVHVHSLWNPFLHRAVRWSSRSRLPIVFSPHGMLTPWALRHKAAKKWLALVLYQLWDLRKATLLHVTAPEEIPDVRRLGLRQPVVCSPLGVHLHPVSAPSRWHDPTKRTVLFVSRVHPKKGLFHLVDAWAIVRPAGWRLLIAGPDEAGHAEQVRQRAMAAGISAEIQFIGPVYGEEKARLFADSDLFVLPTYSENFGVVVIEALAQKCPVITTHGAPWRELEGGDGWGRCGWWIPVGTEPLVKALREATSMSKELLNAMGQEGVKLVQTKYEWGHISKKLLEAYRSIIR